MTLSALHACVPADDYAPVAKKTQWFAMFFLCIPVGFALGKPAHMHAPREGRISAGAARGWGGVEGLAKLALCRGLQQCYMPCIIFPEP